MKYLAAVLMLGLLVFVHEFGHFIVAKLCGVEVPVFSFGFGRRLAGFTFRGTEYRLSLLPFGGYVRMAGADPHSGEDDEPSDPSRGFMARPVWQRLLVVAAGPAFNLALPFVVFTAVLGAGEPQPDVEVGMVDRDTPAAEAGLRPGDRVLAVDGVEVRSWPELAEHLEPGAHELRVARGGEERAVRLRLAEGEDPGFTYMRPGRAVGVDDPASPAGRAGIRTGDLVLAVDGVEVADWLDVERRLAGAGDEVELRVAPGRPPGADAPREGEERAVRLRRDPAWRPHALEPSPAEAWGLAPLPLFVDRVSEELTREASSGCSVHVERFPSPAHEVGIRPGDRFLSLGGRPVGTWNDVLAAVRATMVGEGEGATARPIEVVVVRAGEVVHLEMTPRVVEDIDSFGRYYYRPIIGVLGMGGLVEGPQVRVYYGLPQAFSRATEETLALAGFIVEQIGKIVTGEAAVEQTLGGPIEMMRQAGRAAEQGIFAWARLLGMLSISLGIVNLLPVPVLDGGQLLFYGLEAVRGRPVSVAFRERAQQVGVLLLVALMLAVLVFDIARAVGGEGP